MSSRYLFSSVRWRQHRIHLCYKLTHTQTNTERPRLYLLGVLSLDLWRLTSRLLGWHTHKLFDTEAQCAEIKVHIIKPGETNCCHITLNTKRCSRLKTEVASYACWFFKAYTAAGHQGATVMWWVHSWGADMWFILFMMMECLKETASTISRISSSAEWAVPGTWQSTNFILYIQSRHL